MRRPSPAFVLALIALIVALSGTGYAATKITSKDVKNNSLTGADIKNNSLRGADIRNGTVGANDLKRRLRNQFRVAGASGVPGPQGAPGAPGAQGHQGRRGQRAIRDCRAQQDRRDRQVAPRVRSDSRLAPRPPRYSGS